MMENAVIDAIICVILGVLIVLVAVALGARGQEPGLDTIPPPVYVVETTGQDG